MISIDLFEDPFLEEDLFNHLAVEDDCEITGNRTLCIDPQLLRPHFDRVIALYEPYDPIEAEAIFSGGSRHDDGLSIWDAISEDFGVFSSFNDPEDNQAIIEKIYQRDRKGRVSAFLNNPVYRFDKNSIYDENNGYEIEYWERFKKELKYENRFFPTSGIGLDKMKDIFEFRSKQIIQGEFYYRARESEKHLTADRMGPPPLARSKIGRANPRGIAYLYLSTNRETCEKEIRIKAGSYTAGKFEVLESLKVVDLTNHYIASPFSFGDQLRGYIENLEIMKKYVEELSSPADAQDPYFDYLPTQYICELIKKNGFDGITFRSSLSKNTKDINLTLFNNSKVKCVSTTFHQLK